MRGSQRAIASVTGAAVLLLAVVGPARELTALERAFSAAPSRG